MNISAIGFGAGNRHLATAGDLEKNTARVRKLIKGFKLATEQKSAELPGNMKLKDFWNPKLKDLAGAGK